MRPGILLVDKPAGLTSHDVVARVRRAAGTRKVGHAGTLDPMATGLLVVGVESATRLLTYVVGADKRYEATIRLGSATTTDDAEGETTATAEPAALAAADDEAIAAGVAELTGDILQSPSAVSAIKVDGRRAYDRVRAGEQVELAKRPVTVSRFEVRGVRRGEDGIDVDAVVDCSSGTYIRALARDLGAGLGVGGHLTALRRTRVGAFEVADAAALDDLDVSARLLGLADAAATVLPVYPVDVEQAIALTHGKRPATGGADGRGAAVAPGNVLVGVVDVAGGVMRSVTNMPDAQVRAELAEGAGS